MIERHIGEEWWMVQHIKGGAWKTIACFDNKFQAHDMVKQLHIRNRSRRLRLVHQYYREHVDIIHLGNDQD